jgi:transcription antitermination factor NusG
MQTSDNAGDKVKIKVGSLKGESGVILRVQKEGYVVKTRVGMATFQRDELEFSLKYQSETVTGAKLTDCHTL